MHDHILCENSYHHYTPSNCSKTKDDKEPMYRVFRTTEELTKPEEAIVVGSIPEWINGSWLRSGPGIFELDPQHNNNYSSFQMNHLFDGYAILSKFSVHNGKVSFYKKFLESESLKRANAAGKPCVIEYGTKAYSDPTKSLLSKLVPNLVPPLSDNCNMCVYKLGNEVFASTETNLLRSINPNTLETGDKFDAYKMYSLNQLGCHPLTDETGTTYNIGPSMVTGYKYNVLKIPPPASNQSPKDMFKKAKILCSIPSSWNGLLSFCHSFAMTKNYIIIIEQPYCFVATKIFGGILTRNLSIMDWLQWRPELKNNFIVIEKATGKVVRTEFTVDKPFFYLHIINSFEENGNIVIDVFSFPNSNILESMTVDNLRAANYNEVDLPHGARYVLPMMNINEVEEGINLISSYKTSASAYRRGNQIICTPETITEPGIEMPAINKKFIGKKYHYYYATGTATKGHFRNSLVKVDTTDHKLIQWQKSRSHWVGEPIFIPHPKATSEDDGVLITAVTVDGSKPDEKDFLLVIDAKTFEEVGRAYVNSHIPQGIHGTWIQN